MLLKLMGASAILTVATLATSSAAPAIVGTDLNVRAGQGTQHSVIDVMPQGTIVDVTGCSDGWCYVRDYNGYASARYLDIDRRAGYAGRSAYAAVPYSAGRVYQPGMNFGIHFGPQRPYGYRDYYRGPFGWR
jgi:uncharacterized protein YraI